MCLCACFVSKVTVCCVCDYCVMLYGSCVGVSCARVLTRVVLNAFECVCLWLSVCGCVKCCCFVCVFVM